MSLLLKSPSSLKVECIWTVAKFLKNGVWREERWPHLGGNPFVQFPSPLLDDILKTVLDNYVDQDGIVFKPSTTNLAQLLHPVIVTNKVESVTLIFKKRLFEEMAPVFTLMAENAERLKYLSLELFPLRNINMVFPYSLPVLQHGFNKIAHAATNLKFLSSNVYFDHSAVQNMSRLESLRLLSFPDSYRDLVPHANGVPLLNASPIRVFRIIDRDFFRERPIDNIVFVLTHMPRLSYIQWNVAEALDFLHGGDVDSGRNTKVYNFRKVYFLPTSDRQVKVLVATCPSISNLNLIVRLPSVYFPNMAECSSLANLSQLAMKLMFDEPGWRSVDYLTQCVPLLRQVRAHRLKSLKITYRVVGMNYQDLNLFCPFLTRLCLEVTSDVTPLLPLISSFLSLRDLAIAFHWDNEGVATGHSPNNLILMSCPPFLQILCLYRAHHFMDEVLEAIINNGGFCNVESLALKKCGLTVVGLITLLNNTPSLKKLHFTSRLISRNNLEVPQIVNALRPEVEFNHLLRFVVS